jgi:hypothetical protein
MQKVVDYCDQHKNHGLSLIRANCLHKLEYKYYVIDFVSIYRVMEIENKDMN